MRRLLENDALAMSAIAWMSNNPFARIVCGILLIYILACILTSTQWFANAMMFHPPPADYSWQSPDVIRLQADKQTLAAIWLPNAKAEKSLVYFHGNAENIENTRSTLFRFHDAGLSVLGVEYPGYGMSEGSPSERCIYASADAALDFLTQDQKVAVSNIVVLGVSIGSGPACYLAEKHQDLGGLIIQSGFSSAYRTATRIRLFPNDPFPNIQRMQNINCAKLFLHGTSDTVVSYRHAKQLYEYASAPRTLLAIPGADHNDLIYHIGLEDYAHAIYQFSTGQAVTVPATAVTP